MTKEGLPVLDHLIYSQQQRLGGSLWAEEGAKDKYAFELSPNVKLITERQENELREISGAIFTPGGYLHGAVKMFSALKDSDKLKGTIVGGVIWKALSMGINKYELGIQGLFNQLPLFTRCDLMTTTSGDGKKPVFQIAEVEGDKTHGMGYYDGFILPTCQEIVGGIPGMTFVDAIKRVIRAEPTVLIVGDSERFYMAEMERLLEPAAKQAGLNLVVTSEVDLELQPDNNNPLKAGEVEAKWLVNIPTLNPEGHLVKLKAGAENLYELFKQGKINTLIPPNRFLCNKALLGIISNGLGDPEMDKIVQEYFNWQAISLLRKYIPETILVTRANIPLVAEKLHQEGDNWVIKKTVSSGAKGVSLGSDNQEKRNQMISAMMQAPLSYIIQRKVDQVPCGFWHTQAGTPGLVHSEMYTRTELYSQFDGGILTVGVTARESKAVHVQKDAIQIPVRFVSDK